MEKVTSNSSAMFGTPPEPLFNYRQHGASPEMLKEWLTNLLTKNNQAVINAKPEQGAAISEDSVQLLFLTCERMKMSCEVKYLSLELLDRFLIKHVQDLYDHVKSCGNLKTRGKDWQDIKKRVTNQVVLRMTSCIQIASKLTSHYRLLTPEKARRFLKDAGHRYNNESILQSELRVLKTLNFCVSQPSPLVYLECLLENLGEADPATDVKVLHGVSLKFLDMVYLQLSEIYERLQKLVLGRSDISEKDRDEFASVRADKALLMASVITAAAYIVDKNSHKQVLSVMAKLTDIPAVDIADFTGVILQTLFDSSED